MQHQELPGGGHRVTMDITPKLVQPHQVLVSAGGKFIESKTTLPLLRFANAAILSTSESELEEDEYTTEEEILKDSSDDGAEKPKKKRRYIECWT